MKPEKKSRNVEKEKHKSSNASLILVALKGLRFFGGDSHLECRVSGELVSMN